MLNPSIKVAGLIVSAPPTGMNINLNPFMKFIVKNVVSDMKEFLFTTGISHTQVSEWRDVQNRFLTDWYCAPVLGGPQAGFLGKMLYDFKYNAHLLKVPTYIHYGTNDVVVSIPHLKTFYERMKCEKKFSEYENAWHELHADWQDEVFANTLSWI